MSDKRKLIPTTLKECFEMYKIAYQNRMDRALDGGVEENTFSATSSVNLNIFNIISRNKKNSFVNTADNIKDLIDASGGRRFPLEASISTGKIMISGVLDTPIAINTNLTDKDDNLYLIQEAKTLEKITLIVFFTKVDDLTYRFKISDENIRYPSFIFYINGNKKTANHTPINNIDYYYTDNTIIDTLEEGINHTIELHINFFDIESELPGKVEDLGFNADLSLVKKNLNVQMIKIVNFKPGIDDEDIEVFRRRLKKLEVGSSFSAYNIENELRVIDELYFIRVKETDGISKIKIFVTDENYRLSDDLKNEVIANIVQFKPVGVQVSDLDVKAPIIKRIEVDIINLRPIDDDNLQSAIRVNISDYFKDPLFEESISRNELINLVYSTTSENIKSSVKELKLRIKGTTDYKDIILPEDEVLFVIDAEDIHFKSE